jgi:hypothetical protein
VVDNSLSGIRVARELDQVVETRGAPCMVVSDNGTELTSRHTPVAGGTRCAMALHRARQAKAEWIY